MKRSVKNFLSKCEQMRSFLRIFSHLLKKSLTEHFYVVSFTESSKEHGLKILVDRKT